MKLLALSAVLLASAIAPTMHGDFGHYTFALTWQPGICSTGSGCTHDQPRVPLIGLHGLWPSRPSALVASGVPRETWWSKGCDLYHRSVAPPPISSALRARLEAIMPHYRASLLTHEYDKHVQCFGFDPTAYFSRELAMRTRVVDSAFGRYLVAMMGRDVSHRAVVQRFDAAFATTQATSLQLQCAADAKGRQILTQIWITIIARRLTTFPQSASLVDSTTNQDTCPASFLIPTWSNP